MTAIVKWDRVSRWFDGEPEIRAVNDVSFEIAPGDYVSIVGASGSGKSTLLNVLGLLDTPTGGIYTFMDQRTDEMKDRDRSAARLRSIAFVFQSFHLIDRRTVVENVALPLLHRGVAADARTEAARTAIDQVGLTNRASATIATLSGGERQRVALARAIVCEPDLLLCDEPTGNLDATNAHAVIGLIEGLNETGTAVVVVTHDDRMSTRASTRWTLDGGLLTVIEK